MCSFVAAATIASTAFSAIGTIQQGQAAAAMGEYQMRVAENRAQWERQLAEDARRRGEIDAARERRKGAYQAGSDIAQAAANGVLSGSMGDVILGNLEMNAVDAQIIRDNAEREAISHEAQAGVHIAQGQLDQQAGASRQSASYLAAGATALGGVPGIMKEIKGPPKRTGVIQ